jgi:hypothetical protein
LFERIAIDVAGPFPQSDQGNQHLLMAMDYFTKWLEAYAIPNQEALAVAEKHWLPMSSAALVYHRRYIVTRAITTSPI